jgi:DNA-binding response OmpR family regulator
MIKLLLIEDDAGLCYIIKSTLEEIIGGYEVLTARNGAEGLLVYAEDTPDIIVSDVDMPVMDGLEMAKQIRKTNTQIPILFASGKNRAMDVTAGYAAGCDNYIKKDFLPEELDVHVKKLIELKRPQTVEGKTIESHRIGKYTFDAARCCLAYKTQIHQLTSLESQILTLLYEKMGDPVPRNVILAKHWGVLDDYFYASRSLDVIISRIRKYLSKDKSVSIKNIRNVGLVLKVFT